MITNFKIFENLEIGINPSYSTIEIIKRFFEFQIEGYSAIDDWISNSKTEKRVYNIDMFFCDETDIRKDNIKKFKSLIKDYYQKFSMSHIETPEYDYKLRVTINIKNMESFRDFIEMIQSATKYNL